jgi:hypothetical protein
MQTTPPQKKIPVGDNGTPLCSGPLTQMPTKADPLWPNYAQRGRRNVAPRNAASVHYPKTTSTLAIQLASVGVLNPTAGVGSTSTAGPMRPVWDPLALLPS